MYNDHVRGRFYPSLNLKRPQHQQPYTKLKYLDIQWNWKKQMTNPWMRTKFDSWWRYMKKQRLSFWGSGKRFVAFTTNTITTVIFSIFIKVGKMTRRDLHFQYNSKSTSPNHHRRRHEIHDQHHHDRRDRIASLHQREIQQLWWTMAVSFISRKGLCALNINI